MATNPHQQPFQTYDDAQRWPLQLGRLLADPCISGWLGEDVINRFIDREYERLSPFEQQVMNKEAMIAKLMHKEPAE